MMRIQYRGMEAWPPLAWLARCPKMAADLEVFHGPRVETERDWYCEAVWPGDYASGGFDKTDIVFGSGARVRDGTVTFVSAGSTLDRLHSLEQEDAVWISNSLPCLLSAVDGSVDPAYPDYTYDFRTIRAGLGLHKTELDTTVGPIRLTYFYNQRWDGRELRQVNKPAPVRDLSSYSNYRAFLDRQLKYLARNLSDALRSHPYEMISTMSSGYDSPAIAVLARPHGLRQTFSFRSSWKGIEDSGREVADRLGVDLQVFERGAWRSHRFTAVPFLAADANGGDVDFAAAEDLLQGRVLLTGHMGYGMWGKREPGPNDHNLARSDHAGLSLSEYRLWAGFLHVPVPSMGARQLRDVHAITHSPDMAPWDVGGKYNRPIPRRIVEEAGVPRGSFAALKKGVSLQVSSPSVFWSAAFVEDYLTWLRERQGRWLRNGRIPPLYLSRMARPWQPLAGSIARGMRGLGRFARRSRLRRALGRFASREYLYKFLFPWALERAKERYRPVPPPRNHQTVESHRGSAGPVPERSLSPPRATASR